MRLLLVVCLLGSWSTTFLNLINATTLTMTLKTKLTSTGTTQRMSSPTITPKSSTVTQTTETAPASRAGDEKGKTSVATEQPKVTSITASTSSEATTTVKISLTTDTPVTSLIQSTIPSVQPQNANSSPAPHSTDSTASSMKSSPIQSSTGLSGTENSNITSIQSTTAGPYGTTAAADSGQVALSSTQTPKTSESTSFSSKATDTTVIQATTAGPQTSETTLQNTSTNEFSTTTPTSIPSTESKSKSTSTETQDIVITMVQRNDTNITVKVSCGPEGSEEDDYLEFDKFINCSMYVRDKGKKLGQLLCGSLIKKQNIEGCSHCLIKLSKVKTSDRRLNIDISFKVDTNNVKSVLSETKEELKELGIRFFANQGHKIEQQTPSELKKRIAMVVTGALLLLILLSVVVYRCSQRKSHNKKDQYLTEETQPVDNGCHDNLAMDITECEPEMQEKPSSKVNMQDNMDNWIVPMDSLTKDEVEEEDTHL
ncbi:podocalyxin [Hemiscyllium ocellatum]|uniref:podocalyxin n=1 Tax=Hemiscyllium ocellatum TaxID=170820 RepID=UPI00296771AB|nr:podocalyxin [Hemiscyllium ocellatum]